MRVLNVFADRLLAIVAPRVTASAIGINNCYYLNCFCSNHIMFQQYCCFINGRHECTPCQNFTVKC